MLPFYHCKWRLDGTPNIPMAKRMESFEICDCGMLVTHEAIATTRLASSEYNVALQSADSTMRKLNALYALTHDESAQLLCVHYMKECGDKEAAENLMQECIDALCAQRDRKVHRFRHNGLAAMQLQTEYIMYPEDRLVDLYRQTAQWDKAHQLIQQLRHRDYDASPYARFAVLDMQEKLIKAQDSSLK